MRRSSLPLPFFSAPLAAALKSIEGWIKSEDAVRIIAATARMSELRRDDIPSHVQILHRPLKGRRVITRNARHFKQTRLRIAHYPESRMEEMAVPELLCVISGTARIYAGNYILQCQPGDFILIPSLIPKGNFSYAIDENPQSICDVLHVYPGRLLGEGLECWIARSQGDKIETSAQLGAALFKDAFLASFFDQLCYEIKNSSRSEITYFFIRSLVLLLQRELEDGRALKSYIKNLHLPVEQTRDPIKYALTYIDSHLDAPLRIADMARETALSATNFKLLFRRATGQSFHQYLITARVEFAKTLLSETDVKVQEVAERAGLSPSRLNRLFHIRYSCSPAEYRKKK